jgi:hypothetical protein
MTLRPIAIGMLICVTAAAQQQTQRPRNDELELPIPIASPRALEPGTVSPLSPEDKVKRAIRNTISVRSILNRAFIAGYNHVLDDPEEWSGNLDGYGQRFVTRMGRLAVRQGVQLSTDLAFGIDPRYDRCDCTGFKARTGHAWRRIIVSRRDNGGEIFAVSNFVGAYVPPMITDQWLPARENTWGSKLSSGSQFLVLRGATNMLREFWPEISRKLRLRRFKADD